MENTTKNTQPRLTIKSPLVSFNRRFPNESACKQKFLEFRRRVGVKCPVCGCEAHYYISTIEKFQCKNCNHRQGLRANTVMHHSRLPFRYWFLAFQLVTSTKNSFSAAEIQRQLGHQYYRPIWQMMMKISDVLGISNDTITLNTNVELDECFISTRIRKDELTTNWKGKPYKHKKPYKLTKTKCVVACESIPVNQTEEQSRKYHLKHACGRLKMFVVPDFKMATIHSTVVNEIEHDAIIRSDATLSHKTLPDVFRHYTQSVIAPEDISKTLPYVHIAIGNLKAMLRNVHHCVSPEYLQMYLNIFVWKFNNRTTAKLLNTLMDALVISKPRLQLNHYDS